PPHVPRPRGGGISPRAAAAHAPGQGAGQTADGPVTTTPPAVGTYAAPAENGGSNYTPPAPANPQTTDPGSWDTQAQVDQNGVWSQQAGDPKQTDMTWAATGGQ
ncbi:hypothetical protein, partial [Streptococcus suis]